MNFKNEIYLTLLANIIIDFLKQYSEKNTDIIFSESNCSSYKAIRFSTDTLEKKFKPVKKNIGYYKNGHFAYYEIKFINNNLYLYLNVNKVDLPYDLDIILKNYNC